MSGKIREGEVKHLRMFQYLEGSQFFAWNCAPFLVALSSFATYTTVAGGTLDSQTAFVSLTLFNTLRGPLFLLPFGIAAIIQGSVALRRINTFLNSEELDTSSVSPEIMRYVNYKMDKCRKFQYFTKNLILVCIRLI